MSRSSRAARRVTWTVLAAALAVAGGGPAPAAPAASPVAIAHDAVACIVADRHPQVDACLSPAESVGRAQVHFRAGGTVAWYAVDLKPEGRCFRGLLPRPLRTTQAVEYYVDVVDRGFAESRQPERAPDVAYTARVVGAEGECLGGRLGTFASRVAQPIVVTALRGGQVVAAAAGVPLPPIAGFSSEGILIVPPGAGTGAPQGSGGEASGAGAPAAAGATVAGIGVTTLAIAGGAVVAAGVVVAASSGGDDGAAGGGNGGGGGEVDLTGNWSGPWTTTFSGGGVPPTTCAFDVALSVRHSGGTFSGTGTSSGGQCAGVPGGGTAGGGSGTFSGTASGGRVAFAVPFTGGDCPPFQYVGTYTANAMSGTMSSSCTLEGLQITWSGTWSAARR
jgi:hypothetical protein